MNVQDYKLIFVHGFTSTPLGDWYPSIAAELQQLGADFVIPTFPETSNPKASDWVKIIGEQVDQAKGKRIVLIGHSLGTRAIELYLETTAHQIDFVFFIAAFDNDPTNKQRAEKGYQSFFEHDVDFLNIRARVNKFVVIHSPDDPDIPFSQAQNLERVLHADLINASGRGHLNDSSNYDFILGKILPYLV